VIPGPPALCQGTVVHRREAPEHHQFTHRVSQVWIDPDDPAGLCDLHTAWSHRHPAPARFRRSDYGDLPTGSLAEAARRDTGRILGRTLHGPVRMLSQVRRWGWLFNPITLFFIWDQGDDHTPEEQRPIGAVLEVTNTPWKERTRYPLILEATGRTLTAEFDKAMHVSPFLTMDHRYQLVVQDRDDRVAVDIDVVDPDGQAALQTRLRLQRRPATRELLGRSIRSEPFPTHRVTAGIHSQAVRLWAKRVPIIPHPTKTTAASAAPPSPLQGPS
jgi:DUF1365 family protein